MPSKIRVLDEQTINQIAAGEVIENPASVVKELVENSLDAGATDICVEIKGGGRQLIRITDNGCGMSKDDALLCLERHATSKIKEVDDIHAIATMGFRGEAVPSIASISKFTLLTAEGQEGTMVSVDGGKVTQCCSIVRSQGTTIEVKNLFFNVPVRKKFQKSPMYDTNEVQKMLTNVALGYPDIKFELISDQKQLFKTASQVDSASFQDQLHQRIEDLLGNEFATSTYFIQSEQKGCSIAGYVGMPSYTRHNRTGQYLFINKRAVYSPLISFAVRDGLGTALLQNRHPVFVLHLTLPGKWVDVNVHPQKKEVRLRNEQELREMIMSAVRNGFKDSSEVPFSPEIALPKLPEIQFSEISVTLPAPLFKPLPDLEIIRKVKSEPLPTIPSPLFSEPLQPQRKVLATLKHYIIVDGTDGLSLIDQKAAHSRVIFEELLRYKEHRFALQSLLIPYTFETTPVESAAVLESLDSLNSMGICMRQAGPNSFLVDAIPQTFGNTDVQLLIQDLIRSVNELHHSPLQKEREKQIAMAAARASIPHRHRMMVDEAQKLVDRLMQCQTPFQCPVGKPTMVQLSLDEIARRFQK